MNDSSLVGVGPLARLVVLSGLPASGKTTLYRRLFAATHEHVSKDHWPNARRRERRQRELVARHLREGRSVVVDNTNPTAAERAPLAAISREMGLPAASFSLRVDLAEALARNAARQGRARVPYVALASVARRLTTPSTDEGFDELYEARLVDGLFVVVDVLRTHEPFQGPLSSRGAGPPRASPAERRGNSPEATIVSGTMTRRSSVPPMALSERDKTPAPGGWEFVWHHAEPQRSVPTVLGDLLAPASADDISAIDAEAWHSVEGALVLLARLLGDRDHNLFLGLGQAELARADAEVAAVGRITRALRVLVPVRSGASDDGADRLRGMVHAWLRDVRVTGYDGRPNEYVPPGTVGDMEVLEVGTDGRVIHARFHPGGEGRGYGLVVRPRWEPVRADEAIDVSDEEISDLRARARITDDEAAAALGKRHPGHGRSRAGVRARIATVRDRDRSERRHPR